jgi:ribosome biogenesis GTPase
LVVGVHLARYLVQLESPARLVTATLAKELRRERAVVGDWVKLTGDTTGAVGSLARIAQIEPRKTLLSRSAEDSSRSSKPIVANADQLAIVIAAANPEPRIGLVDRYLAAAYQAGVSPILIVTKSDLADPSDFLKNFEGLEFPIFRVAHEQNLPAALEKQLLEKVTVFVGHSGVGKSTLINRVIPEAQLSVGEVNVVTGRGKHTSSAAVALSLGPSRGWLIDTPGVRSFGLGHLTLEDLVRGYPELQQLLEECPKGCLHREQDPDCELVSAESRGQVSTARLASLRRIIATVSREHWED